eukprot:TRINITY_DN44683_c0_g1_i1.p1 TRINITY_DN44683_c0_g1~~TRINITY_DN44683_c0_g1_i1.p1  ORF type:complete len:302 (+),score=68.83 TRINITY_DN44683_c0_g1_i1:74-979(+)
MSTLANGISALLKRPSPKAAEPKAKIAKSAPKALVVGTPDDEITANAVSPPPISPPPSPSLSEGDEGDGLRKSKSWQEFSDTDPVYALIGELSENSIYDDSKTLRPEVLEEYINRLFQPGIVRKLKQWVQVWAAMNIPPDPDSQAPIVLCILEVGLSSEGASTVPEVLTELLKGHRTKLKAIEDSIQTLFECGDDQEGFLVRWLMLIFPKSPTSEWGWSRVGWNWQQWWSTATKVLETLDSQAASEMLKSLLRTLETESGTYLPHQQIWDEKRLEAVRQALCKYGETTEEELSSSFEVVLQ